MKQTEINEILRKHKLWLDDDDCGERANMRLADMRYANLESANLKCANLERANLRFANLRFVNLLGANLEGAIMEGADLEVADLKNARLKRANLEGAKLAGANLVCANLERANLRDADIDYSAWPLWCGSLNAHVDDRIAIQLLYHALSVVQHSPYVSEEIKRALLTPEVVKVANRFHRVDECGELSVHDQEVSE